MKNHTLLFLCLVLGPFSLFSQVSINIIGDAVDYSGSTYSYYASDTNYNALNFEVHNNSAVSKDWVITRVRINPPATWSDYLCWGHQDDLFGGTCVDAENMDSTYYQMAPTDKVTLAAGEYGKMLVYHKAQMAPTGTFTYRYYVGESQGVYEDSLDVEIIVSGAGLYSLATFDMQVAPNPSAETVQIFAETVQSGTLNVFDVAGNSIQIQHFSSNATLYVADWKPGIYFVTLTSKEGLKASQKLIVR